MYGGKIHADTVNWKKRNPGKNAIGSRAQVWHNNALKTRGGLTKKHLMKNPKTHKIVSKKANRAGHKAYSRNRAALRASPLFKRLSSRKKSKRRKKSRKRRR
jgi:hypothetical protein